MLLALAAFFSRPTFLVRSAQIVMALLVVWGSWTAYIKYQRWDATRVATAALMEKLKRETAEEISRRTQVLDAARKNGERIVASLDAAAEQTAATLKELEAHVSPEIPQPDVAVRTVVRVGKPLVRSSRDALDARSVQLLDDIRRAPRAGAGGTRRTAAR